MPASASPEINETLRRAQTVDLPANSRGDPPCITPSQTPSPVQKAHFPQQIVDDAAVTKHPLPALQFPTDRAASIETYVEPFMKPVAQRRTEVVPITGLARVKQYPATAAALTKRLVFQRRHPLSGRHLRVRDFGELAEPVVNET